MWIDPSSSASVWRVGGGVHTQQLPSCLNINLRLTMMSWKSKCHLPNFIYLILTKLYVLNLQDGFCKSSSLTHLLGPTPFQRAPDSYGPCGGLRGRSLLVSCTPSLSGPPFSFSSVVLRVWIPHMWTVCCLLYCSCVNWWLQMEPHRHTTVFLHSNWSTAPPKEHLWWGSKLKSDRSFPSVKPLS